MSFSEIIKKMPEAFFVNFFFIIITASIYRRLIGTDFMPLSVIYEIALMTALISLSDLLFYSKKELRRLGLLIRHIINLVLSIVIVLSVAIFAGWIPWNNPILVGAFVGMVVVVYLMSEGVEFYRTKIKTDEMTKKIKKLNK